MTPSEICDLVARRIVPQLNAECEYFEAGERSYRGSPPCSHGEDWRVAAAIAREIREAVAAVIVKARDAFAELEKADP